MFEQNQGPKPGPQNRQFRGDAWTYPHSLSMRAGTNAKVAHVLSELRHLDVLHKIRQEPSQQSHTVASTPTPERFAVSLAHLFFENDCANLATGKLPAPGVLPLCLDELLG